MRRIITQQQTWRQSLKSHVSWHSIYNQFLPMKTAQEAVKGKFAKEMLYFYGFSVFLSSHSISDSINEAPPQTPSSPSKAKPDNVVFRQSNRTIYTAGKFWIVLYAILDQPIQK